MDRWNQEDVGRPRRRIRMSDREKMKEEDIDGMESIKPPSTFPLVLPLESLEHLWNSIECFYQNAFLRQ